MARSVRIEYPGALYHVMARGNRRERIYRDEADRRLFLQTLGEACQMTAWRVHAWMGWIAERPQMRRGDANPHSLIFLGQKAGASAASILGKAAAGAMVCELK